MGAHSSKLLLQPDNPISFLSPHMPELNFPLVNTGAGNLPYFIPTTYITQWLIELMKWKQNQCTHQIPTPQAHKCPATAIFFHVALFLENWHM